MTKKEKELLYEKYSLVEGETLIGHFRISNPLKKKEMIEANLYVGNILTDSEGNRITDLQGREYCINEEKYQQFLDRYVNRHIEEENSQLQKQQIMLQQQNEDIKQSIVDSKESIQKEISENIKEAAVIKPVVTEIVDRRRNNTFVTALLTTLFVLSVAVNFLMIKGIYPFNKEDASQIYVIRLNKDIKKGDVIMSTDIEKHPISLEEYMKIASVLYIDQQGITQSSIAILYGNRDEVIGKYALNDLKANTCLTNQDFTNQKVVEERTELELEIDGQKVTVEIEDLLKGNTTVKIIALIEGQLLERQIAIPLSEFVLTDRSIKDILTANGQSILEAIALAEGNE